MGSRIIALEPNTQESGGQVAGGQHPAAISRQANILGFLCLVEGRADSGGIRLMPLTAQDHGTAEQSVQESRPIGWFGLGQCGLQRRHRFHGTDAAQGHGRCLGGDGVGISQQRKKIRHSLTFPTHAEGIHKAGTKQPFGLGQSEAQGLAGFGSRQRLQRLAGRMRQGVVGQARSQGRDRGAGPNLFQSMTGGVLVGDRLVRLEYLDQLVFLIFVGGRGCQGQGQRRQEEERGQQRTVHGMYGFLSKG